MMSNNFYYETIVTNLLGMSTTKVETVEKFSAASTVAMLVQRLDALETVEMLRKDGQRNGDCDDGGFLMSKGVENTDPEEEEGLHENQVAAIIRKIKLAVCGSYENPVKEANAKAVAVLLTDNNVKAIPQLITLMTKAGHFDTRMDIGLIFRALISHNFNDFVQYLVDNEELIIQLTHLYQHNKTALITGAILRDAFEFENFCDAFLGIGNGMLTDVLIETTCNNSNFDILGDALSNLTKVLTKYPQAAHHFMVHKFDHFFGKYNMLLNSTNFVVKKQSMDLLRRVLLDPLHFTIMMKYVGKKENLKLAMMCLRDKSPKLRLSAFHLFKIFVANPQKTPEVVRILSLNQKKLLAFLECFDLSACQNKKMVLEEKRLLVHTLKNIEKHKQPLLPIASYSVRVHPNC